jgi:uncharacterized protein YggU (UPF0235/DUF167 family)
MYIHVRIKTKQKEEFVEKLSDTKFVVSVKAEPKQNRANTRMIELLKEYFNKTNIKIVSGHHSPSKLLAVD